ncbi:MAG: biopolymer transporter ExbD [Verrucomicrobia bacterium]|nr:MAG: biopolymer transporter ExbD [Verrucomicrobiota bacterium]
MWKPLPRACGHPARTPMPVKLHSALSDDEGDEARIEVVPLIDIMFFLLAAFMLVSLSMTQLQRVPLRLPEAASGSAQTQPPPVQIAVDAHGVITWDRQVVTPSEITARLKHANLPPEARVLISADQEARYKQMMAVLDAVREAGIEKVGFETKEAGP